MVTVKFHINCDQNTTSYPGSIMLQFLLHVAPNVNSAICVTNKMVQKTCAGIAIDSDIEIFKKMIGIHSIPFESGVVPINITRIEKMLHHYSQMKKVAYFLPMLQIIFDAGEDHIELVVQVDQPCEKLTSREISEEPIATDDSDPLSEDELFDRLFG